MIPCRCAYSSPAQAWTPISTAVSGPSRPRVCRSCAPRSRRAPGLPLWLPPALGGGADLVVVVEVVVVVVGTELVVVVVVGAELVVVSGFEPVSPVVPEGRHWAGSAASVLSWSPA